MKKTLSLIIIFTLALAVLVSAGDVIKVDLKHPVKIDILKDLKDAKPYVKKPAQDDKQIDKYKEELDKLLKTNLTKSDIKIEKEVTYEDTDGNYLLTATQLNISGQVITVLRAD